MIYEFDTKLFMNSYLLLGFLTALIFFYMIGPEELETQREIVNETSEPKMPHWAFMIIALIMITYNWPLYLVRWNDWNE